MELNLIEMSQAYNFSAVVYFTKLSIPQESHYQHVSMRFAQHIPTYTYIPIIWTNIILRNAERPAAWAVDNITLDLLKIFTSEIDRYALVSTFLNTAFNSTKDSVGVT